MDIHCLAKNCLHNENCECNAKGIHVRNGEKGESPRCTTYSYRLQNRGAQLLYEMGLDMSIDREPHEEKTTVSCGVHNCKYNLDYICNAIELDVLDPNSCDTLSCGCRTYRAAR